MRLAAEGPGWRAYDEVLPAPAFAALWRWAQRQRFRRVHEHGWDTVWRFHDGEPVAGEILHSARSGHDEGARVYPTGTAADALLRRVARLAPRLAPLVGRRGRDWVIFTGRTFLYPPGTGLSWHSDGSVYSGAWAFYAHPRWNAVWGGELMIARTRRSAHRRGDAPHLDNRRENEVLDEIGAGTYITPKPNRLVVIAGSTPHMINRVHTAAGTNARCTIAGFFVRASALPASRS